MEESGQPHVSAALSPGKRPQYRSDRKLVGLQSLVGIGDEENTSLTLSRIKRGRPSSSIVTKVTELSRLTSAIGSGGIPPDRKELTTHRLLLTFESVILIDISSFRFTLQNPTVLIKYTQ
jgi:hypothetical protein